MVKNLKSSNPFAPERPHKTLLVIMYEYQNIKNFLAKNAPQIGLKKFL